MWLIHVWSKAPRRFLHIEPHIFESKEAAEWYLGHNDLGEVHCEIIAHGIFDLKCAMETWN